MKFRKGPYYLKTNNKLLQLYFIGLKGLFENQRQYKYMRYKIICGTIASLFSIKYLFYNTPPEFELLDQPNFLIPQFVYKAREDHYKYWELSRLARNKKAMFSYYYYDPLSDFIFYINEQGKQSTQKNNLSLEKLETIDNPQFEQYIRTFRDTNCMQSKIKGNLLIAYTKNMYKQTDLKNYLYEKSITPFDILRSLYYQFMVKMKFTNHYRYDHIINKPTLVYQFEKLKLSLNQGDKSPQNDKQKKYLEIYKLMSQILIDKFKQFKLMNIGQTKNKVFHPENKQIIFGDPESLLFCCGKNENYELSFKNVEYFNSPAGVKFSKKHKISEVSTMGSHTAFLSEWGEAYMFGSNLCEKLGLRIIDNIRIHKPKLFERSAEVQIEQICCGENFTLCLFKGGETWAWGGTLHKKASRNLHPNKIPRLSQFIVRQISCGVFHSAAVTEDGYLFTWGGGGEHYNKGQLGHNSLDDISVPEPVQFFQNKPILRVECGEYHTMVLTEEYELYAWGSGQFGELGNDLCQDCSEPQKVIFPDKTIITRFAGGKNHSMFITNQGKLYACGKGAHGQLGTGYRENQQIPIIVQSLKNKLLVDVKCGVNHTIVLAQGGYVYSTGNNKFGQLGLGHNETKIEFEWIDSLKGKKVKKIFAGGNHSWFLLDYDKPYDIEDRSPSPPIKVNNNKRSTSKNSFLKSNNKNQKLQRKNSTNSKYSYNQKINLTQVKEKKQGQGQIQSFLKQNQSLNLSNNDGNNQSFLKRNRGLKDQQMFSQNKFNQPRNFGIDNSTNQNNDDKKQKKSNNLFNNFEESDEEENIFNNDLKSDKNGDSLIDLEEGDDEIIDLDDKPYKKKTKQNDLEQHHYTSTFGKEPFINKNNKRDNNLQDLNNFNYNNNQSDPEQNDDSDYGKDSDDGLEDDGVYNEIQNRHQNINRLQDDNNPNIDLQTSFDSINKLLDNKFTCYYNLFFTDFQYNHKFFLISYKKQNEQLLESQLIKATDHIQSADPELIQFKMGKYQKFYKEENQVMSVLQIEDDNIDNQEYENYVLMLIQTSQAFQEVYKDQEIPESPYNIVDKLQTSVTPLYYFTPELIEKDQKWKILSTTCEILKSQNL